LATEAFQEIRIKYRWEALDAENEAIERSKQSKQTYIPEILSNGDTLKQLLARSRYLLYKHEQNWTQQQALRANLLFDRFPDIKKAHD
jgi:transposase